MYVKNTYVRRVTLLAGAMLMPLWPTLTDMSADTTNLCLNTLPMHGELLNWLILYASSILLYNSTVAKITTIVVAANLLLQDTIERIHVGGKYGDIPRGIFLVRGENMVLVGEIVSDS